MKKVKTLLTAITLFALGATQLKAQNLDFINYIKSSQSNSLCPITSYVRDNQGNYYIASDIYAFVTDSFDLGLGGQHYYYTPSATGQYNACLVKYDSHFNIQWVVSAIGGINFSKLSLAENGASIIVAGSFVNSSLFYKNGTLINSLNLTSAGGRDVMIAKFDTAGNAAYAESFGGAGNDAANSLKIDNSGRMIITGSFAQGNCDFDPTAGSYLINGGFAAYNIFAAWYNIADGTFVQVGAWINVNFGINDVAITSGDNVLLAGSFSGTMNADPTGGTSSITSAGGFDCVLITLSSSAGFLNVTQIGGTGDEQFESIKVYATDIYLGGYFNSAGMDFDPGAGIQTYTPVGGADAFFMKLDQNNLFQFAKAFGGTGGEVINGMFINYHGIYAVGSFAATVDFDPGALIFNLTAGANYDGFLAHYDLNGNFIQAAGTSSPVGPSRLDHIAIDPSGIYATVSGFGTGNVNVGMNDSLNFYFPSNSAQFIATYDLLAPPPTLAASNITFSNVTAQTMTVHVTRGNGSQRIIVAHQGSAVNSLPANANYYGADSTFTIGRDLGGGNYTIYNDTGNVVTLTGLQPLTTYYFSVFEYNGTGYQINFITANEPVGNKKTLASPYRWVDSVIAFSSQYDSISWCANQVRGVNDVYPNYGDMPHAWASATPDAQREWLMVHLEGSAKKIHAVNIFETYSPGAVDSVYAWNPGTVSWDVLWSGHADTTLPAQSRINHISFPATSFNVSVLRIALNSPFVPGYNEIDAINVEDTTIATAIGEISSAENSFSIYPNPCSGYLNITTNTGDINTNELKVFDAVGREVYSGKMESESLKLQTSNWAEGIYIVKLGETAKKFVKN